MNKNARMALQAGVLVIMAAASAQSVTSAKAGSPYAIDGLSVGGMISPDSWQYKRYECSPSESYQNAYFCEYTEKKGDSNKKLSFLHLGDNHAAYVNKTLWPAAISDARIQDEIAQWTRRFGKQPQAIRQPPKGAGLPTGVVFVWGDIRLRQISGAALEMLAQTNQSPNVGFLVDYLIDPHKSARLGLPVYTMEGGEGFVWIASLDEKGVGKKRMFAVDPSRIVLRSPPSLADGLQIGLNSAKPVVATNSGGLSSPGGTGAGMRE